MCFCFAEDVSLSSIGLASATVSWRIPSFEIPEQYYVEYGREPDNFTETTDPIASPTDNTLINRTYEVTLQGLQSATVYYYRVAAVFNDIYIRYSDLDVFVTKEPGIPKAI